MTIPKITSPTLLIDKPKVMQNIQQMADKASAHKLNLKPHFKTHQSAQVGSWFREFGVDAITVSSVSMARFFAEQGWDDITIAFPVNTRKIDAINKLAADLKLLSLFVLDLETAELLNKKLTNDVQIYVEIDTGAGRSGFRTEQIAEISSLVAYLKRAEYLNFAGFYSHPGHSYNARSEDEILKIHREVLAQMNPLKDRFQDARCCIGDTPCSSVADDFGCIDEISPGNFVYYDLMQAQIGAGSLKDVAVALAAPVVAKYPKRSEVILHGGAIHLSKDSINWRGHEIFGRPVLLSRNGWSVPDDESYIKALSQEHGVLKCSEDIFNKLNPGDLIGILPVHSCLAANLMDKNHVLD